jgi:probable phosphoglycerate mutase
VIQGITDIPLNDLGNLQADMAAIFLANTNIDTLYSSHLTRALQTASKISKINGMNINIDKRLAELEMGIFAGYTRNLLKTTFPYEYKKFQKDIHYVVPGGESYENFKNRVLESLYEIIGKCPQGNTVCIVSHGGVIECIRRHVNKKHKEIIFANSSISELFYDNNTWEVSFWNNTDHLIL